MNYPPANLWKIVLLDPPPEAEPALVQIAPKLRVPASWTPDRRRDIIKRHAT